MTTITDILQRPDIRELRQQVYAAYEDMARASRNVEKLLRYRGDEDRRLPYYEDEADQAAAAYREAQAMYHAAINAACAEAGLPPYIGSGGGQEYEPDGDFWQTLREAAMVLGVTPDTLRQQIHNGAITAEKRGRDWYIRRTEVTRYGRERKRKKAGA